MFMGPVVSVLECVTWKGNFVIQCSEKCALSSVVSHISGLAQEGLLVKIGPVK